MNKPQHMKNRQRGRNNGGKPRPPGGGPRPNFDGGMRPRGNAQQLMEKFLAMARDAGSMGDRVAAENYYQHADHYYRVLNARFEAQQQQNQNPNQHGYNNGQRHPNQGGQRFEGQGDDQQQGSGYDQRPNYDQRPPAYQQNYQSESRGYEPPQAERAEQPVPAQNDVQPSRAPEGDIGLPPQVLGMEDRGGAENQSEGGQGGDDHDGRGPRRRRGRGHGGPRQGGPGTE